MINRVKHRVEHLRSEPEHVRQRTVLLMTGAGGIIAVLLWLVVLLPIQMGILNNRDETDDTLQATTAPLANDQQEVVASPQSRVGGIQDQASGQQPLLPSPSPTISPLPTSQEERLNSLDESSPSPTIAESPSSRPVQTQGAGFQVLE